MSVQHFQKPVSLCFNFMVIKCAQRTKIKNINDLQILSICIFTDSNWNLFNLLTLPILVCWMHLDGKLHRVNKSSNITDVEYLLEQTF